MNGQTFYGLLGKCHKFYQDVEPEGLSPWESQAHRASQDALRNQLNLSFTKFMGGAIRLWCLTRPDWTSDNVNSGYLVYGSDSAVFRVPFHIAPAFPAEFGEALWNMSRKVQVVPGSVIALSGSAVQLGSTIIANDLDFCEYIQRDGTLDDFIAAKRNADDIIVLKAPQKGRIFSSQQRKMAHDKMKCIGHPRPFRPIRVSNLMLFCDKNWNSAALRMTFGFQEVALSSIEILPHSFDDLKEVGRYLDYLLQRIDQYLREGKFIKCLKRILSLTRFCFDNDTADRISNYLSGSSDLYLYELQEVDRVQKRLENSDHVAASSWLSHLLAYRQSIEYSKESLLSPASNPTIEEFTANIAREVIQRFKRHSA